MVACLMRCGWWRYSVVADLPDACLQLQYVCLFEDSNITTAAPPKRLDAKHGVLRQHIPWQMHAASLGRTCQTLATPAANNTASPPRSTATNLPSSFPGSMISPATTLRTLAARAVWRRAQATVEVACGETRAGWRAQQGKCAPRALPEAPASRGLACKAV